MYKLNYSKLTGSAKSSKVGMSGSGSSTFMLPTNYESKLLDDMIGSDNKLTLNSLYREIYLYDNVSGPAVDLMSTLPWSDCILSGVTDPAVIHIYEDTLSELNIHALMIQSSVSYLVLGTLIGSLIFNESKGIFTDLSIHDPDHCNIASIPLKGYDPKIDLKVSKEMKKFLRSKDPRDREALKEIPNELYVKLLKQDVVQLEPLNTVYLSRSSVPGINHISYYTRILPIWLIEKALMRGTIIGAWRRQRGITHLTVGDDQWEPTDDQLDALTAMYINADQDPMGAVLTTRQGVDISQGGSGNDFWRVSDDWDVFTSAKMRALSINDDFLSGAANFSTADVALSMFIETQKAFRDFMTTNIIYNKIFLMLSKYHEIRKVTAAQLDHRIRIQGSKTDAPIAIDNRARIIGQKNLSSSNKYLIPSVHWMKDLSPKMDSAYLDTLIAAGDKGVPIPLALLASAAGLNMNNLLDALQQDIEHRKRISEYKEQLKPIKPVTETGDEGGEEGMGDEESEMTGSIPKELILTRTQANNLLDLNARKLSKGDSWQARK